MYHTSICTDKYSSLDVKFLIQVLPVRSVTAITDDMPLEEYILHVWITILMNVTLSCHVYKLYIIHTEEFTIYILISGIEGWSNSSINLNISKQHSV